MCSINDYSRQTVYVSTCSMRVLYLLISSVSISVWLLPVGGAMPTPSNHHRRRCCFVWPSALINLFAFTLTPFPTYIWFDSAALFPLIPRNHLSLFCVHEYANGYVNTHSRINFLSPNKQGWIFFSISVCMLLYVIVRMATNFHLTFQLAHFVCSYSVTLFRLR